MEISKDAQYVLDNLLDGYHIGLVWDAEECVWFVYIREWQGCLSQGDTITEAIEMICDAAEGWYDSCMQDRMDIPEPLEHAWDFSKGWQ